jgi:hypothetical protein
MRGDGKQEVKEKGKTIKQTRRRKQNKESNKKFSKVYRGSLSVLINSKLNRHQRDRERIEKINK